MAERLVLAVMLLCIPLGGFAQGKPLTLSFKDAPLKEVFAAIEKNSDYVFVYYDDIIDVSRKVTLDAKNRTIKSILDELFKGTANTYEISDNYITISKRAQPAANQTRNQPKRVTGVIRNESGEPLVAVTVVVKNRPTVGTATDVNGKYLIDVQDGDVLTFSYVGYNTQDIPVGGRSVVDVVLVESSEVLEEVTVVGFGVQKKISVIGSQQSISASDVKVPVRSVTNSLAGRLSGVVAVQRSGEPGHDNSTIYIRGISTLTASMSEPLTLVDGVPRSISDVDPEDIESFSVLKDASATAVYGVRGANGVIIINTKGGKIGKPKFNIRYTEGITRFTKLPEFADGPLFMQMSNEALTTRGGTRLYSDEAIQKTRDGSDPYLYPNVNWFDWIFKDFSNNRTANANISGGSDSALYYIGLGYYDESGMYKSDVINDYYNSNARYRRYNVTANITLKPGRTTEIKFGVQGYLSNGNFLTIGSSELFGKCFYMTPTYVAPLYPGGLYGDQLNHATPDSPYALLNGTGYSQQWKSQLFSNLRLTQQLPFVKGLSATALFSFDTYNYTSNRFSKTPDTWAATGRDGNDELILEQTRKGTESLAYSKASSGNRSVYGEVGLNYVRTFGKHDVTGMLLYNLSDEINTQASSVETALPYRFMGLAGRFTYGFDNRYFAEFNFGYNGSENFTPKNRYGFFPSFGVGWVMSNESFFEPATSVIQHLKLRVTYGQVGNSNITGRRFAYLETVNTSASGYIYGKNLGTAYGGKAFGEYASDVSWEVATKYNLGIDITTLKNKLNIQVDLFKDVRSNILLTRSNIPYFSGLINNPLGNVGEVENKGIETSVNYNNRWGSWGLSLLGNFSFNRNKIIEDDQPWPYPWLDKKGKKVDQRYGYIALGLFESEEDINSSPLQTGDVRPGDIKYKDLNADGRIDSNDIAPIGWGSIPEIVYGFGFTVNYKNLSLSALFQGAANVDIMMSGEGLQPFSMGLSRGNLLSNIEDRWTEDNPSQDVFYPRLMSTVLNMNYENSTWWLKNSSYLRLKNLQLTYDLPKKFLSKIRIESASVFFQAVNVFTISGFKLWDVELGDGRGASYPNISSYSIGLNFSF